MIHTKIQNKDGSITEKTIGNGIIKTTTVKNGVTTTKTIGDGQIKTVVVNNHNLTNNDDYLNTAIIDIPSEEPVATASIGYLHAYNNHSNTIDNDNIIMGGCNGCCILCCLPCITINYAFIVINFVFSLPYQLYRLICIRR